MPLVQEMVSDFFCNLDFLDHRQHRSGGDGGGSVQLSSTEQVLDAEAQGEAVDRRNMISEDSPTAHAHRGLVSIDDMLVPFEELQPRSREQVYEGKRDECGETVADHLRLARWCRSEGLDEQCRAHLQAVLSEQPNHLLARRRPGT